MPTLDWSRRLDKDRGLSMEEGDRCCCCCCCRRREGGAGQGQGQGRGAGRFTSPGEKTRLHQLAARLVTALLLLLLLVSAALALLLVREGRCLQSRDGQPMKQADSHSSGTQNEQQQVTDATKPSAMLTAPLLSGTTEGIYLEWESEKGNAHCRGGFNYSGGSLLVPRTGVYRVFLQVTYERSSACSGELRLSSSVSFITDSYAAYVPLLSSVDTVSCSLEQWSKSLYTAGSFTLEAGSRLRVASSHRERLVNKEELLFFGAELLT